MESFFRREIIITEDGSSSIFLPGFGEHYHSVHGAVQESKHVFMDAGWEKVRAQKNKISILEIGFGTGLNAFLVLKECLRDPAVHVKYTSLEAYPVSTEDAVQLNYAQNETEKNYFVRLHTSKWNEAEVLTENFTLEKVRIKLKDFVPGKEVYDLIFFDAFSPNMQPELWTEEVFQKMFESLKSGAVLVTYCAKGQVRRNMQAAGFVVERLKGPPGKREMIRAGKKT